MLSSFPTYYNPHPLLTHGNEKQFQVVIRNRDKSVPKWNSAGLKVGHGDCEARNWEWIHRSTRGQNRSQGKGAAVSSEKELSKQGVCHTTVALPFTVKSISRQKKNNGNSNISPCKNTIFKKSSKTNQNPSRYYKSRT
jgi:hypothetical protein